LLNILLLLGKAQRQAAAFNEPAFSRVAVEVGNRSMAAVNINKTAQL